MKALRLNHGWHVREAGEELWHPATVPGGVHEALIAAGVIPDPFVRDHEPAVRWVGERDWEFRLQFAAPPWVRRSRCQRMVFDGLDTCATVRLNGRVIVEADNMFRPWSADVAGLLKARKNVVSVMFRSPVSTVRQGLERAAFRLPCPNDQTGGTAPYTRKTQYQYGWDWGPCLVDMGFHGGVRLEAWDEARITGLHVRTTSIDMAAAVLVADCSIESSGTQALELRLLVDGREDDTARCDVPAGTSGTSLSTRIRQPRLWWPAGMGGQPLYTIDVQLWRGTELLDTMRRRVGLRSLEVCRVPDGAGASFEFVVNGRPFFAKGANWIPADSFPARVSRERYRDLLEGARAVNMNMLRVWGGGTYERDVFYDLCDELGILVWQDFMFACALYPGDEAFVASVRKEAEFQVARLRHHPAIALWCGNNENEWGWFSWGWKDKFPSSVWDDYRRIFDDLLPGVCRAHDPDRLYWPSSPASDVSSTGNPNDYSRGDVHYWEVWGEMKATPDFFRRQHPRFASEFGFQSFPDPRTVAAYADPGERSPESAVMLLHQKAPQGNEKMRFHVQRMFGTPRDEDSFFVLSQLVQAEFLRTGVEHFRGLQPRCRGALYWQLNDCWPAASWSSMDYFGRWKALHYAARRFFAPHLLTLRRDDERLVVRWIADGPGPVSARLTVRLMDVQGAVLQTWHDTVAQKGEGALDAWSLPNSSLDACDRASTLLVADLSVGRRVLAGGTWLLVDAAAARLPEPGLAVEMDVRGTRVFARLQSRKYAPAVILDAGEVEGRFEDNYFSMRPGEERRIPFRSRSKGERPRRFAARSLVDLLKPGAPP